MKTTNVQFSKELAIIEANLGEILKEIEQLVKNSDDQILTDLEVSKKRLYHLTTQKTKKILHLKSSGLISKEVFDFLGRMHFIDRQLINLWKVKGYEFLCCSGCLESKTLKGSICICRVPSHKNRDFSECSICGCSGCSGS